jgi:transcriptional regulator with XRE-family HTH domain
MVTRANISKPRSRPIRVPAATDSDRDLGRIIGRHVRDRRLQLSMTQEDLATYMGHRCHSNWDRQTVGRLERSERLLTIFELLVLAQGLKASVLDLMVPEEGDSLRLGDGTKLKGRDVITLVMSSGKRVPRKSTRVARK